MAKTGVCRDWPMKKGVSCGAHRYDTFSKTGFCFKGNREKSKEIGEPKSESRRTTDQTTGHLNTVHRLREPREGGRQGELTG
jgi:hypothetical protein